VAEWTADAAAVHCGVLADDIRAAARLIGRAERLLCTALQGVYQSPQATAAAVQVNNLALIRGMLGRPGAGVLQMNGQPTAQNTRECGANGDLPGFRNWDNDEHVQDLASVWNVDPLQIPHFAPPTHAMEIFRYCEEGRSATCGSAPPTPQSACPSSSECAPSSPASGSSSSCRTCS
jgi:anaerobic selenocysteine-containing dehydrogenase